MATGSPTRPGSMGIQPGDALYLEFENGERTSVRIKGIYRALWKEPRRRTGARSRISSTGTRRRPAADVPD